MLINLMKSLFFLGLIACKIFSHVVAIFPMDLRFLLYLLMENSLDTCASIPSIKTKEFDNSRQMKEGTL